nr:MAG TPA_asm: phospholipase A2 [Caudoviricetes sp.]
MNVSPLQASRYWVSLRHFIHYQCDCCKPHDRCYG